MLADRAVFMDHPEGAVSDRADRVDFDRRVRPEFRGAQLSSDGGLLVMRELDDHSGYPLWRRRRLRPPPQKEHRPSARWTIPTIGVWASGRLRGR